MGVRGGWGWGGGGVCVFLVFVFSLIRRPAGKQYEDKHEKRLGAGRGGEGR